MAGAQEKSEKPTGKKLGDARKRGNIPKSRELTSVAVLMAGALATYLSSGLIVDHTQRMLLELWTVDPTVPRTAADLRHLSFQLMGHMLAMVGPTFLAATAAAVGTTMIQLKGFYFSVEALQVKLSNINPIQGLQRLFSVRSLVELMKALAKLFIIGYAVVSVLRAERQTFITLSELEIVEIIRILGSLSLRILYRVGGVMLFLSILDFMYQKWQHQKDLMMTKQEVKEEHKQSDGNPLIKSRIRSLQRTLARQRMLARVPKASVVITNPTHFAVALLYAPGMEAPRVLAKGADHLAHKIIASARKHRVPVVQNPPLARALYKQVKLEETIPTALYQAVAKVLAYIYQQKQRAAR